jgi:flavin reductase (DIM6/NTAB) family NADH-FMN oxidoreductase RutF
MQAPEDCRAAGERPNSYTVVFGSVVAVYVSDRFIKDGMVDAGAMQPIARMG